MCIFSAYGITYPLAQYDLFWLVFDIRSFVFRCGFHSLGTGVVAVSKK